MCHFVSINTRLEGSIMPLYNAPIEEIEECITRPVIVGVTKDILNRMDLPKNMKILFKGEATQQHYRGSEITASIIDQADHNRYMADPILYLDVNIEDNEHQLLSTAVQYIDQRPLFSDPKLSLHLYPGMVSKKIDITMTMTGSEKETERWRAELRRKTSQGAIDLVHMVNYNYPIPTSYMVFLIDAFNMRQAVNPYPDDTLGKYLKEHFRKPYSVKTNPAGNGTLFSISEHQLPIQGWFDFGTKPPKVEKDNNVTRYSLTFTYSFYFDCPETINIQSPLVIHNQMLKYKYLPKAPPFKVEDIITNGPLSQEAFNAFRFNREAYNFLVARPGLAIPWFDDWLEDKPPKWYLSWLRLLIQVDNTQPNLIADLKELGNWSLNHLLVRYLKSVHTHLNKPYETLLNISLWRWAELTDMDELVIDEDLVVKSTIELGTRDLWHMSMALCIDPTALTSNAIEELKKHPCFLKHYFALLRPEIVEYMNWDLEACSFELDPNNGGGGIIETPMTDDEWNQVIDIIDENNDLKHNSSRAIWNLVAGFAIHAHHKR